MTNNKINTTNPISVSSGGTGVSSLTAYTPVCGGTTTTGAVQPVASIGTSGQFFTSNGAGSLGSFQAAPSAGKLQLIQTLTASSSASLIFNTGISSAGTYMFVLNGVIAGTSGGDIRMQVSNNGGSSWTTSNYTSGIQVAAYNSNTWVNDSGTDIFFSTGGLDTTSGYGTSGIIYVFGVNEAVTPNQVSQTMQYNGGVRLGMSVGYNTSVTGINAFKFYMGSGNIASGSISLYYFGR